MIFCSGRQQGAVAPDRGLPDNDLPLCQDSAAAPHQPRPDPPTLPQHQVLHSGTNTTPFLLGRLLMKKSFEFVLQIRFISHLKKIPQHLSITVC